MLTESNEIYDMDGFDTGEFNSSMMLPLLTYTCPARSEGKVAMLLRGCKPILTVSSLPFTSLETELRKGSHARRKKKNYFLAAFDSIVWLLSSQFSFLLFDWSIDISVCNRSITGWERGEEDKAQSHGGRRSPMENKTTSKEGLWPSQQCHRHSKCGNTPQRYAPFSTMTAKRIDAYLASYNAHSGDCPIVQRWWGATEVIRFPDGGRIVLSTFTAIARHLAVPLGDTGCKSKKKRFAILHR